MLIVVWMKPVKYHKIVQDVVRVEVQNVVQFVVEVVVQDIVEAVVREEFQYKY